MRSIAPSRRLSMAAFDTDFGECGWPNDAGDAAVRQGDKRRLLIGATGVVGGVGVVAAADAVRDVVLAVRARESRRRAGRGRHQQDRAGPEDRRRVARQGRAGSSIARRRMLDTLPKLDARLADPNSDVAAAAAVLQERAPLDQAAMWVAVGICTHLGCSPTFRPEVAPADFGPDWMGGFFCPCHQSKFDLAGRVFKGVPAPTNLVDAAAQVPRPTRASRSAKTPRADGKRRALSGAHDMEKLLNWIDARFPLTALWEVAVGQVLRAEELQLLVLLRLARGGRAGDADRHRHLPDDELQARRARRRSSRSSTSCATSSGAGSSATCTRPARRCSSSSSICTCSAD